MKKKYIALLCLALLLAACEPASTPAAPPTQPQPSDQTESEPANISPSVIAPTALPPTSAPVVETETPGTAVGPTERISPIDGMPQLYVPAGMLRMGGLDVHADDRDELPAHTVSLGAFWVDQLEVTNAMYMLCVQAAGCEPPMDWSSNVRPSYFNDVEFKDYPVVHVTWQQAETYCKWAGRRLPTEAEWERAARGDDFRNYPWGDAPASGEYANFNYLVGETSRVGSYLAGASPYGALDMAGNVWEWVADLYEVEYYKNSPEHKPPGPDFNSTNLRVIRGGSYQDAAVDLRVSKRGGAYGPSLEPRRNDSSISNEHSSKIGFRCVMDE